MIAPSSVSTSAQDLATIPLIQAALERPVPRKFLPEDLYVVCFDGQPQRVLRVQALHHGPHPAESSYSVVWLPTVAQMVAELLERTQPLAGRKTCWPVVFVPPTPEGFCEVTWGLRHALDVSPDAALYSVFATAVLGAVLDGE